MEIEGMLGIKISKHIETSADQIQRFMLEEEEALEIVTGEEEEIIQEEVSQEGIGTEIQIRILLHKIRIEEDSTKEEAMLQEEDPIREI